MELAACTTGEKMSGARSKLGECCSPLARNKGWCRNKLILKQLKLKNEAELPSIETLLFLLLKLSNPDGGASMFCFRP